MFSTMAFISSDTFANLLYTNCFILAGSSSFSFSAIYNKNKNCDHDTTMDYDHSEQIIIWEIVLAKKKFTWEIVPMDPIVFKWIQYGLRSTI